MITVMDEEAESAYRVMLMMERCMSPQHFSLTIREKQRYVAGAWNLLSLSAARQPTVYSVARFNRRVEAGHLKGARCIDTSRQRGLAVQMSTGRTIIVTVDRHLSTLIHEIAHAVCYESGEPGGHGPAFAAAEQEIYALAGSKVEAYYRRARQSVDVA